MRPRSRLGAVLAAVLASSALGAPAARADGPTFTSEGQRARVTSDLSEEISRTVAEMIEKALPTLEANLPYRLPEKERLVVHLYGSFDSYRHAARTGPGTLDRDARTLDASKESHVVVQPRSDAPYLALAGALPELTRDLLLHECARQIVLRSAPPANRYWPFWYVVGMAERAAAAALRTTLPKDAPEPIVLDDALHGVQAAVAEGRSIRIDRLLNDVPTMPISTYEHYDQWASFYAFLATDPERLKAFHERVRAIAEPPAPPEGHPDRRSLVLASAFEANLEKTYGPLPALEAAWKEWVRAGKPAAWFEPIRSTQRTADGLLCGSFPGNSAYAVRVEPAPKARFLLSFEWNLETVGDQQAELYLAYEEGERPRYLKVTFRADGNVSMLAQADGYWQGRYAVNTPVDRARTAAGAWHKTVVDADARTILVDVDGERVFEAAVPPGYDVLGHGVGFGVLDGVARFRAVEVKPAPAK